jgi:hypothetical protein
MSWATERRLDWIDDRLFMYGEIQRSEITNYFRITVVVATSDIAAFCKLDPRVTYDRTRKRYVRPELLTVRKSTPERRDAWRLFA